jgi:hypothetical protein
MAGWFKDPVSGHAVFMDDAGQVHLQDSAGQIQKVAPRQAGQMIAESSGGLAPASQQAIDAAQEQATWDNASTGKKLEFYSREATKGAVDAVTALPRAISAGGKMLATAINPEAANVADPIARASGENFVEKVDQVLGNTAQGTAANVEEQRQLGVANPTGKMVANLGGNVAGLIATGGLGEAGALLTGGGVFGAGSKLARAAGAALEGSAQAYAQGAEDAWQKDKEYTTESQWAHMGLGAVLGAGGSVAIDAARAGVGATRAAAEKVFGKTKPAELSEWIGAGHDAADGVISDVLGMPAAPGAGGKLRQLINEARDKVESAAAAKVGISKEALQKVSPLREGTDEIRALAKGHEKALEEGTADLTRALRDVHEEAQPILLEDVSLELKRDHIKPLLTGDHEQMMALGQAKSQELTETLDRINATSGSKGRSLFGGGKQSAGLKAVYEDAIENLTTAAHPADVVVALDGFKRSIGKLKVQAENSARRAGNEIEQQQANARVDLAKQVYADTRALLEDSTVWGKFGEAQATKNARWRRMLDTEGYVQPRISEQTGTHSDLDRFGQAKYEMSEAKVGSYLDGLGTAKSKLLDGKLRDNLVAKKELAQSLVDLYGLDAHAAGLQKIVSASDNAISLLGKLDRGVAASNQVKLVDEAMKLAKGGEHWATTGAVIGGIVGGAPGAALGGGVGKLAALANPVSMLRQLVSLRHTAQVTGEAIRGALDSTLLSGAGKAVAASSRYVGRVAKAGAVNALHTDNYAHVAEKVTRMAADPVQTAKNVADTTGHVEHDGTRDEMTAVGMRMASFLSSKLPKPLYPDQTMTTKQWDSVSQGDKNRFMRYVNAVNNPMQIFTDLRAGRATPEQAETLKVCFPQLFAKAQMEAAQTFMSGKVKADYQTRLRVQKLFDLSVDPTLQPGFRDFVAQSAQIAQQQDKQKQQANAPKRSSGGGKSSVASSLASPLNNLRI